MKETLAAILETVRATVLVDVRAVHLPGHVAREREHSMNGQNKGLGLIYRIVCFVRN